MTIFSPPHIEDSARWTGIRVGLLGGSFDPPHQGHIHASLSVLNTLKLDTIWWLVSPQNPIKQTSCYDFSTRFALCHELVSNNPRIIISDLEQKFGSALTWQTIRDLNLHFPKTHFVWITGMDNALTIHKWHNWTYIPEHVATAHVARPPAWSLIENCPLKMMKTQKHIYLEKSTKVPLTPRHTYWLLQKKMIGISSTEIRKLSDSAALQY